MADFLMPALGADMETGKVVQWLVKPGDRVRRGDVVAVVETHKGAIDVEIFLDGVIGDLVAPGRELPVGAVLATVRQDREEPAAEEQAAAPQLTAALSPSPSVPAAPAAPRAKVSPAARRRAQELGVVADTLPGTGPDGAVTVADIERAAPRPFAPTRRGFDAALMRQAIASAMSRSKREIPHYYLASTIDFGASATWLEAWNRDRPPEDRLLPAALLLKATAQALAAVPQLNGFHQDGAFRPGPGIHIGWAIALRGGGLVAPAIHDVDRQPLPGLMSALRDLVQRARSGSLRSSELTDPTITVTSVGERGAESVLGVIYPPQVAIVGFGRIVERPWLVDGRIAVRPVVAASLAADHRVSDGHVGGLLLAAIDRALQAPEQL
ncbi:MAG TPA: dihydrolipoamide acetyltransferase family protein [Ramlibacter sp.]